MSDDATRAAELLAGIASRSTGSTRSSSTRWASGSSTPRRSAALKAEHDLPPSDPAREAAQIARLEWLAREADLDPEFAKKFLAFIISEVIRHHEAHRK